ncbi:MULTISPECIES: FxSxx-COOH cyclophane-containing RiPP peptide [Streptomyces]|uniref:FxSxx-COOH protein n=1 Tax=Streptomyces griseiscabiei TaxID=2993540 RepID=A0ABU4L3R1_9ACTN|nr:MULTISPECIES: FxSxx-COOH cyclophane-containing RiPP peptide [Streptomyces]MBZ3905286.1 FXSXX-COOH protein [Streptomyces griseiscabiei]MDX2910372.1 FxSxx-COOH protein [Streptomyces griseiscabiei]
MDAPRNSHNSTRLVDISTVPTGRLKVEARKDTVLGHTVRRHLEEREGGTRTSDIVFDSAL